VTAQFAVVVVRTVIAGTPFSGLRSSLRGRDDAEVGANYLSDTADRSPAWVDPAPAKQHGPAR